MTGGAAFLDTLIAAGARLGFGVPGESYLALLEAMRAVGDAFRFVPMRHEGGACFAADAFGKLTGTPGLCFVTRGPGASNAAVGLHTAAQDSTPLILVIGQVATPRLGRESFQEIDYRAMFGTIAKTVLVPESPDEAAAAAAEAWHCASAARPGPAVVVLPEDVSEGETARGAAPLKPAPALAPSADVTARAAALIAEARHPVIVAGGLVGHEEAHGTLLRLVEASGAALAAAWRRQDAFPNDHPAYVGHLGIGRAPFQRKLFAECDLVLAAGCRLDDITTEEGRLVRSDQTLIHVYPDRQVLARSGAALPIEAHVRPALEALAERLAGRAVPRQRLAWRDALHAEQEAFATPGRDPKVAPAGALDMARIAETVGQRLEPGDVVTNDAGNFAGWLHRYFPYRWPRSQLAPTSGAMGYAVPAALAAALVRSERRIVAFVGDGGFLMTGQELSTAVNLGLKLTVIVCDNHALGTILMHQERRYGAGHAYGVKTPSPDFAALARAYGARAFRVESTAAFADAFDEAARTSGPSLIHLVQDLRDISAFRRLDL